jgi:hypothetical protein
MLDCEPNMLYRTGMQLRPSKKKTQYAAPKLTELSSDITKEFLLDQAARGNQEAKDLLNLLRQTSE